MAALGSRVGARLIDGCVVLVAVFVITGMIGAATGGLGAIVARIFLTTLLIGVVGAAYEVTMLSARGQTLGKMAVGIRVVRADSSTPDGRAASIRWGTPFLLQLVPVVGWLLSLACYLSAVVDPGRRGVHDRLAGTWVVAARPARAG